MSLDRLHEKKVGKKERKKKEGGKKIAKSASSEGRLIVCMRKR